MKRKVEGWDVEVSDEKTQRGHEITINYEDDKVILCNPKIRINRKTQNVCMKWDEFVNVISDAVVFGAELCGNPEAD